VPFVAKVTGVPVAKIAARIMAGEKLADLALPPLNSSRLRTHVGVKEGVFPFARFGPAVDTVLGPEMKSTGEVMGIDRDYNVRVRQEPARRRLAAAKTGTVFVGQGRRQAAHSDSMRLLSGSDFACSPLGNQRYLNQQGLRRCGSTSGGRTPRHR